MTLAEALIGLQEAAGKARFPLPLPDAEANAQAAAALAAQIRDYLAPRAAKLDAPLLAVVGGSTGAGKSTLVNSLIGRAVTKPGVLRPTTKSPVLICHPGDADWFRSEAVLPELTRAAVELPDSRALRVVEAPELPAGLALLDAPDVDSVDAGNRSLARQLLLAADLWLFVTSAARYADAVPWNLLREAAARDLYLAVVLNRCPPSSIGVVGPDLGRMLGAEGLGDAPLFALAETPLVEGMIPAAAVRPIRSWLGSLASRKEERARVVRQSLVGTLRQADTIVENLLGGVAAQRDAARELQEICDGAYATARSRIEAQISDGSLLRGEIVEHWHRAVGTSRILKGVDEAVAALRARARRWVQAEPEARAVQVEISDQLAGVLVAEAERAADETTQVWRRTPWGRAVLADEPPRPELSAQAATVVRSWQQDVLELVQEQGKGKRLRARLLALGTNALGATLMVAVFFSTGGLTGAEAGIAGGTSLLAQRVLESVFGAGAVERLAREARELFLGRAAALFADDRARFNERLAGFGPDDGGLPAAAERVRAAREAL
ncbi:ABC transporter [Tessaracoccus sp. OH4464_COT-324]|uniref:ABC transporter n=1 Tax=Tessaracoccus sp. OH4464_COT-324 TaxID=2491059 RepID=UPI000F63B39B|nr:ABC transporter [Tessaracoccus sp. OH4464_COT-324]